MWHKVVQVLILGEVVSKSELQGICSRLKKSGKKIVFTNGCFDLLHVGHIRYLKGAKELAAVLVVGLNSDQSVRKLKGPQRPIQPENDRAEILSSLSSVDFVSIFDDETPLNIIELIRPDILVKGGDWSIDKIVGADIVKSYGGSVKNIQFVEGHSTTTLINKLLTGK